MHTEAGMKWAVDKHVNHCVLEETIRDRVNDCWEEHRLIECAPQSGQDYVTIIWRRP